VPTVPPTDPMYAIVLSAADPGGIQEFTVRAAAPGFQDGSAKIVVLPAIDPASDGLVQPNPSKVPAVAVLDGDTAGGCVIDHVLAFVGTGQSPNLTDDCTGSPGPHGSWTLFLEDAVGRAAPHAWDPDSETVTIPPPAPPVVIPIKVWRAAVTWLDPVTSLEAPLTVAGLTTMVDEDLELSDAVFGMNRAGFEFRRDPGIENLESDIVVTQYMPDFCANMKASVPPQFQGKALNTTGQLNVIYVRDLPGGNKGYSCWDFPVVFVNVSTRMPETLAHELAHQLGLRDPDVYDGHRIGHTDYLPGFLPDNLMWVGGRQDWQSPRDQLSVGQVFRMNADHNRSWAVKEDLTPLSLDCTHAAEDEHPCPRLALDRPGP
jgi:hypothetical protein